VVRDEIRGEVAFPNRSADDFVIARGDGSVLYNFAVAVDDLELGVTHVIRGDDHLSNTPKQLLVMEALGAGPPRYAHLPLLHGPDGRKLSKRHGAESVQELRRGGYLPAAIRNYLALLGWGTGDDTTLMSTEELVERFDLERVGRSSAIFDEQKLRWMNGRFMRGLDPAEYERRLAAYLEEADPPAAEAFSGAPDGLRSTACEIVQEKAQTLAEVWSLIGFLFTEPEPDERAWRKVMGDGALPLLEGSLAALRGAEPFEPERIEEALGTVLAEAGVKPGKLYQPIRVAISGGTVSPGIFESLAALGRDRALGRIEAAISRLRDRPEGA
jgi:glutamyl-tRNA synthetase